MTRKFDPILVEVIKNELAAITEEMAIAVWKTGRSAMMKTGDFATAICDGQGRLIGQGYAAPFQMAFFTNLSFAGYCAMSALSGVLMIASFVVLRSSLQSSKIYRLPAASFSVG